jgi:hypothetical protein
MSSSHKRRKARAARAAHEARLVARGEPRKVTPFRIDPETGRAVVSAATREAVDAALAAARHGRRVKRPDHNGATAPNTGDGARPTAPARARQGWPERVGPAGPCSVVVLHGVDGPVTDLDAALPVARVQHFTIRNVRVGTRRKVHKDRK